MSFSSIKSIVVWNLYCQTPPGYWYYQTGIDTFAITILVVHATADVSNWTVGVRILLWHMNGFSQILCRNRTVLHNVAACGAHNVCFIDKSKQFSYTVFPMKENTISLFNEYHVNDKFLTYRTYRGCPINFEAKRLLWYSAI